MELASPIRNGVSDEAMILLPLEYCQSDPQIFRTGIVVSKILLFKYEITEISTRGLLDTLQKIKLIY
jgi:hypothetical protein